MVSFNNLSPEDLLILTNAITLALSKDRSIDELNVLGNILVSSGSLMLVIAAQDQLLSSLKEKNTPSQTTSKNSPENTN